MASESPGHSEEPRDSTAAGELSGITEMFGLRDARGDGVTTTVIPLGIRLSVLAALIITSLFGLLVLSFQQPLVNQSLWFADLVGTNLPPISRQLLPTLAYAPAIIFPSAVAVGICVLWFRRRAWPTVIASQFVACALVYWALVMAAALLPYVKITNDTDAFVELVHLNRAGSYADIKPWVISDDLADQYARMEGRLATGGPMILTDYAAKRLGEHRGGGLELWGVDLLTATHAAELAKHQDSLAIQGLTALSDEAAAALANRSGPLALQDSVALSDKAEALLRANPNISFQRKNTSRSEGEADQPWPGDIVTLTVEQAKQLVARSRGDALWLLNLVELTPEVGRVLAAHEGELGLNRLADVSATLAKELAAHKRALHLNGLATIPLETAEALAAHEGPLYLRGLSTLTPEVAQALARLRGDHLLLDGVRTLSPQAARALASRNRYVGLMGLTTLPDEAAAALRANPNIAIPGYLR